MGIFPIPNLQHPIPNLQQVIGQEPAIFHQDKVLLGFLDLKTYCLVAEIRLTTWDVWNPINNGKNYRSLNWLAGFQPSTVAWIFFRRIQVLCETAVCQVHAAIMLKLTNNTTSRPKMHGEKKTESPSLSSFLGGVQHSSLRNESNWESYPKWEWWKNMFHLKPPSITNGFSFIYYHNRSVSICSIIMFHYWNTHGRMIIFRGQTWMWRHLPSQRQASKRCHQTLLDSFSRCETHLAKKTVASPTTHGVVLPSIH